MKSNKKTRVNWRAFAHNLKMGTVIVIYTQKITLKNKQYHCNIKATAVSPCWIHFKIQFFIPRQEKCISFTFIFSYFFLFIPLHPHIIISSLLFSSISEVRKMDTKKGNTTRSRKPRFGRVALTFQG